MNKKQIVPFLQQALETEMGGTKVYETAIQCASEDELKEEWTKYLEQTRNHVEILRGVLQALGEDPDAESTGRQIVHDKAESLVAAMATASDSGDSKLAQLVAAECVVDAETKDHLNWELIGELADKLKGSDSKTAKILKEAHDQVEEEEDEHLYHTMGWTRELWIEALGMEAVLPPPEEEKDVKTAIGAARAKSSREEML